MGSNRDTGTESSSINPNVAARNSATMAFHFANDIACIPLGPPEPPIPNRLHLAFRPPLEHRHLGREIFSRPRECRSQYPKSGIPGPRPPLAHSNPTSQGVQAPALQAEA